MIVPFHFPTAECGGQKASFWRNTGFNGSFGAALRGPRGPRKFPPTLLKTIKPTGSQGPSAPDQTATKTGAMACLPSAKERKRRGRT